MRDRVVGAENFEGFGVAGGAVVGEEGGEAC